MFLRPSCAYTGAVNCRSLPSRLIFALLWLSALVGLALLAYGVPGHDVWAVGLLSVSVAGLLLERVWPRQAETLSAPDFSGKCIDAPANLNTARDARADTNAAHDARANPSALLPSAAHAHAWDTSRLSFASLAQACHDLRQPTMASSLSISTARALTHEPDTALHLDAALRASDELNRMIQSMLDLTELDSQAAPPAMSALALRPLLQAVRAQFALHPMGDAELQAAAIRVRCRDDLVIGHAPWITRVLLNLVGNALQHAKAQRILITARQIHGRVHVSVWDDGVGMSAQQLAQLSQGAPVTQRKPANDASKPADDASKPSGNYGLGSSIAQRYARAMGSELRVWSAPGRGTRFDLALPTALPGEASALQASALQANQLLDKYDVHLLLLSQDAELSRQLLPTLQAACACVSVRSTQEFLQHGMGLSLEAQPVSLVILDELSLQPSNQLSDMTYLVRQELVSEVDAVWIMSAALMPAALMLHTQALPQGVLRIERPLVLAHLLQAIAAHASHARSLQSNSIA